MPEVPYFHLVGDHAEIGYIDLLYRDENHWQFVDFKTDTIHSDKHLAKLTQEYASQMTRYTSASEALLGEKARVRICFLDDRGKVRVGEV